MLANRFRSGRVPHQHIGISSFTDNKLVLDVIGNANITNDLTVGGELNAPSIIVSGSSPAQFDDVTTRNLQVSGIATFLSNVSIAGTLTYEDVTNIDSLGIVTARSGIDIQSGALVIGAGAGATTGKDFQYLRSTGVGVSWSDFPTLRTEQRFVTTAGQTTFSYQYNVGFIDVFYNGVKLSPDAEYTATNGTQVVLLSPAFEGDILEIIAYNIVTTGGSGGGSGGSGGSGARVSVGDTAPASAASGDLWWRSNEGQLKIYYADDNSSQWVDAAAGGGGGGAVAYSLPIATDETLGGFKVGTGLTITAAGILSATATGGGGGGGSSTLEGLTDTTISSPQPGQVLKYEAGSGWINGSSTGGLADLVSDTTPQLGGDLDVNGKKFVTTSNSHILLQPNGTGKVGIGNVIVPYSLFHVKGSYPRITLQKTGQFDDAGIDFRTDAGVVGAAISHVPDGNNLVLNVTSQEKLRVSSEGIRVIGISTFNGNVDINGNLDVSGSLNGVSYITSGSYGSTKTINVKVQVKTSSHRYFGTGSAKGYTLDGLESPFLTLIPGITYKFDQTDGSNATHQIRFYIKSDRTLEYTTGVTFSNAVAGNSGSYTQISVTESTPVILYYQCINHPYMGNAVQTNTSAINTPHDAILGGSLNVTNTAVFDGIVDVNNIMRAITVVAENITQNSVVYAGSGGQLKGDGNILYDETSFKINNKGLTVNGGHTQLNTLNVSGISTFVGVSTFKDDVYVDKTLRIGEKLFVSNIEITGADEGADPPSYGEDIVTRNLKTTGIVTTVGPVNFEGNVTFDSTYDAIWDKNASKLMFMDGARATFGNSDDLEIVHTANKNIIHSVGAGTTIESQINTNTIHEINQSGIVVSGVATATKFSGDGSLLTTLGSINTLSDVSASTPTNGHVLKWNSSASQWQAAADSTGGGGGGGSETVIVPVAYAKVNTASSGSGTNMNWGAYNSSNGEMSFTFVGSQADTNYYVLAEREQYDTHSVSITNKTTTGFKATWLGNDGTSPLSPATFGGVLIVYASTPTKNVGAALEDVSVTVAAAGANNLTYNNTTGALTFTPYLLPTATASDLGGVKVDGTTITINNGVITASAASPSVDSLTDTTIGSKTDGDILKWNGTKWVNVPLSDDIGVPRYTAFANFPSASANQGQLAFSDNNKALYLSDGTDWAGQRVVTTSHSASDFDSILSNYEKNYTFAATDYSGQSSKKRIRLSESTGNTFSEFILVAGSGLSIAKSTNGSSETEIALSLGGGAFTLSAETDSGQYNSTLRLGDTTEGTNTDIKFAGADGLTVERTDATTLTFRQTAVSSNDYGDNDAKQAAFSALDAGNHTGITIAQNSTTKAISLTATNSSSGGETYDLSGRSTTTNEAIIDLKDSQNNTDSIQFVGSTGTSVAWDNTYNRITISSPAVNVPDWTVDGGTTASPTGTAGGILNKPALKDIATTGKIEDALDVSASSPDANSILKYDTGSSKWVTSANNLANLTNVSNTAPSNGQVLKWDSAVSLWKPDTDASGSGGATNFTGLGDTPSSFTSQGGKFLKVNSAEDGLEYGDAAGASVIEDVNGTSSSIANNDRGELDITGQTAYTLFKVKASVASWVRLYVDSTSRTNDSMRSEGEDPLPGSGVLAEVRTTGVDQEVLITPGVMGFNNDSPTRTKKIYVAINNRSGSAATVTVTLTILKLGE